MESSFCSQFQALKMMQQELSSDGAANTLEKTFLNFPFCPRTRSLPEGMEEWIFLKNKSFWSWNVSGKMLISLRIYELNFGKLRYSLFTCPHFCPVAGKKLLVCFLFSTVIIFCSSENWVINSFKIVPEHLMLLCCTARAVQLQLLTVPLVPPKKICFHHGKLFPSLFL